MKNENKENKKILGSLTRLTAKDANKVTGGLQSERKAKRKAERTQK